jgi:uncharacterized protein YqeY
MSIVETLRTDMFEASKTGDSSTSDILKMVIATIKNEEIDKGEVGEERVIELIRKEAKKIQDSIDQFKEMSRDDLVAKEEAQLAILEKYLPKLMSEEEVETTVKSVIEKLNASSMSDMGRVMGASMGELKGKADGAVVKNVVQKLLS